MDAPGTIAFEEIVSRARAVLGMVAALVGDQTIVIRGSWEDADTLEHAVTRAERVVRLQAESSESSESSESENDERARLLLNELGSIRIAVHGHELLRRRTGLGSLNGSLHRLRCAATVDDLVARVPHEVVMLGFNRALFSWVEQGHWMPQAAYTRSGPDEARAMMDAGAPPYWHVRDLLEAEMIRSRSPVVVRQALKNPRVHPELLSVTHSHSYVAAPLVAQSNVVGFLHADENVHTGTVDDFDRDLLAVFSEGLGLALERVTAMEELATVRSRVGQHASALRDLMGERGEMDDAGRHHEVLADASTGDCRPDGAWAVGPTRREEQVLQLVAYGLSNAQIAERLYIVEGTAKTHVKSVLRKLGGANRAEAGAMYHRFGVRQS
jgi:DNA-binding CsgD family transcriptional regulator